MCLKVHPMIWTPNQPLKFRTLNDDWVLLGCGSVAGGALSLGQTKVPVGKSTHSMPKSKLSWIGQVAATVLVVATNCYFLLMLVFIPALHWQGRPVRPLPAILGSEMDDSREEENLVAMPAVFCCRGWFLSRKHVLLVIPNVWGLETLYSPQVFFSFLLGLQFALEDFPAPACEIHSCDRAVRYAVP